MVASQPAMYVVNRRGEKEPVSFDQILRRVSRLAYGLHPLVDPARVTQAVINGMYAGIKTSELDELAAQTSGEEITTSSHLRSVVFLVGLLHGHIFCIYMHRSSLQEICAAGKCVC